MISVRPYHAAAAVALVCLVSCTGVPTNTPRSTQVDLVCNGIPADVCQTEADRLQGDAAGRAITAIRLTCVAICDRARGQLLIDVAFADGGTTQQSSSYGQALPAPRPTEAPPLPIEPRCVNLPTARCQEKISTLAAAIPEGKNVTAAEIRCVGSCDERNGRGVTTLRFRDGSSMTFEWGYATGP
jgi:hypothetical protein